MHLRIAALALALAGAIHGREPVRIIFDTDIGNDIDDALALAVLHAFESRGEARLLAVTITKDHAQAAPFVDLVNTFYRRPEIPIGVVRRGKTPEPSNYLRVPVESRLYPHRLASGEQAPEAVALLRRVLGAQPDGSVTIVQVGFSTNLARLLDSPPDAASPLAGRELAARKVRLLSIMAGQFPGGKPEYNVRVDIPAARRVFEDWPTPVVASGFEIGEAILYPAASIENDFGYVAHHPVADAYRAYHRMPYDRPTWDLTSVLYAVRPERGYFSLSAPGAIRVDAAGRTLFTPQTGGTRRYLLVDALQRARTLEALVALASQPPTRQ